MIQSMTGFGRAVGNFDKRAITVEIKSLNSKNCDTNIRLHPHYKAYELEVQKVLKEKLKRGKIDCTINIEAVEGGQAVFLNQELVKSYIKDLQTLAPEASRIELLQIATRFPDVLTTDDSAVSEAEWECVKKLVEKAADALIEFRKTEGKALYRKLQSYIENIEQNLQAVAPFEESRLQSIKTRLLENLKEFEPVDEARFYQELAYYAEKLDISEEKVRLTQHCKYYKEVMSDEEPNGKKLGFIAQEMGREINTLGSKANHQEIQKLVVKMKDDLEKIKEQTLNVL